MFKKLSNPKVRKYIYGIIVAAIPVLLLAGVLVPGSEAAILTLAAAVLGLGSSTLAVANTDRREADVHAVEPEDTTYGS